MLEIRKLEVGVKLLKFGAKGEKVKILKLAQLREWFHSDSQRMRMWAPYQLIENHDDQPKGFCGRLSGFRG
ncbi:MAG: hypothetical protein Ct9H90mP8_3490 [Pseudomonadota bacterium]|nr:MAG: hypothetical protein Ct9H90mP8_3490 [Pseudomonadota bacterium]